MFDFLYCQKLRTLKLTWRTPEGARSTRKRSMAITLIRGRPNTAVTKGILSRN